MPKPDQSQAHKSGLAARAPRSTATRWRKRVGKWWHAIGEILALAPPRQRALVIIGTFVSSVLDLIGLTMMVPFIIATTSDQESTKGVVVMLHSVLGQFGIPFAPLPIMAIIITGLTLKGLIGVLVTRYADKIVGKVTRDMRIRLIHGLLGARWSYFVRQSVGRLAFAIGPEADASGQCFGVLTSLIASVLQVSVFVVVLGLLSWQLLAIAVLVTLLLVVWFGGLVRQSRRQAKEQRQEVRQRAAKFTDTLTGIKPIRAMGRAERFAGRFEDEARLLEKKSRPGIFSPQFAADLQEPVVGVALAIGIYFAVTKLQLEIHDLLIMSILMVKTIAALMPMQRLAQRFIQSYDQYRSLNRLLQISEDARETWSGREMPMLERDITFDEVSFSYRDQTVLNGLNLRVPSGEITALIGPSGVGKSTIVDLLVGLYQPSDGMIRVDGTDLQQINLAQWRRDIGYIPQEVLLFHDTVRHNVTLFEEGISDEVVMAALAAAGASEFVIESRQGLDTVVGERGSRLSGGQRQRISIARALLHRPRLLILDEATTGLDQETEWAICAHVRRLCESTGLTVLAVSHQPAWQRAAHQVYRIEPGGAAVLLASGRRLPDLADSAA
jgi:ATP-binding cassette subfamily C protein